MNRSTFEIDGQYVTHTGTCPWTQEPFVRRYWIPEKGGYVRLDDSKRGDCPGTLGRQPHTNGTTWRAANIADLVALVKREWRAEKRQAKAA